jgi:hypothetical protein
MSGRLRGNRAAIGIEIVRGMTEGKHMTTEDDRRDRGDARRSRDGLKSPVFNSSVYFYIKMH